MRLAYRIEDLLQKDASDLEISKFLKTYIQNYFDTMGELFAKYQGKEFLVRHTKYIDSILTSIYKVAIRKLFGLYVPLSNSIPITLVALGSYGREQLAPYSDIDLMILYEEIPGYNTKAIIEKILYIIWDANLKLGHRVHELKELKEVASSDITIKTALLESRFICGSKYLWFKFENSLQEIRKDGQKEYILQKTKEYEERRKRYPLSMEPHIKEGVGGLRDSNYLYWIANVIYSIKSLKNLSGTLFSEEEYREYRIALEWLFKVRVALHIAAKKKEDRLLLQYIPDVARLLEIKAKNDYKSQQALVTKTLQAMHTIDTFTQIFAKKLIRPYLFEPANIPRLRKSRIAPKLYNCNSTLYSSYHTSSYPIRDLLNVLAHEEFRSFDPSFIRYAKKTKHAKTISKTNARIIKKLYYKERLTPTLHLLHAADLLPVVVPPLKKVMFMPQFDGYHRYPVVLHSIVCVEALENISDPFIKELYDRLDTDTRAMLKLTVLLHDSGKGRKQRHHEVGAKLFKVYATKLGFSQDLIERGVLLIKHHTDMTSTAYNKDIHNEKVVLSFLAPLKEKLNLDLLYILTYADVNGVGSNVYTPYNAKLLRDLYEFSLEALQNKTALDEVAKRVKKEKSLKKSPLFQGLPRILQKKILSIESNLFFIKHSIGEIIEISKRAYETKEYSYSLKNDDYLCLEIIRTIPLNLGYLLGKLSFLDIASMEVFKLFDEKKYFKIEFREPVESANLDFIKQVIEESFNMEAKLQLKKPIIEPDEIEIDCEHSKTYAQIEINAKDQKGLLAYIAKVFDDFGIDIATAKVHTIKYRAHDLFLIEKRAGVCEQMETIVKKLTGE